MDSKTLEAAEKFLDFHIRMGNCSARHFRGKFNVNGKGGRELTSGQFFLLMLINQAEFNTISDLEDVLHTSKSSISITVSRMVKNGYIEKCLPKGGEDGRKVLLKITEKGQLKLKESRECLLAAFGNFYESLDKDKQKDFVRGIELLSQILE